MIGGGYEAVSSQQIIFAEDLYLFDLKCPLGAPLAYRCARGGQAQPDLLHVLGISARQWMHYEQKLFDFPLCLGEAGGAVVLPLFGSLGRFVVVLKPDISVSALAHLAASARFGEIYAAESILSIPPAMSEKEQEAAERFVQTFARMRLLIDWCSLAESAGQAEDCISLASELFGVELMSAQSAEFCAELQAPTMPDMKFSGKAFAISLLVLLSAMRNDAHARSGWLYAADRGGGVVIEAAFRTESDRAFESLAHMQAILADGGVMFGTRTHQAPVKPPRQYAYMHKKITDPQHPYCARCGCLDKRCAACTAVQWAILPYVCDAALLGIKNYFCFGE